MLTPFIQVNVCWTKHHRWESGMVYRHHVTADYILWLLRSRTVQVRMQQRCWQVTAGDACLMPPNTPREIEAPTGAELLSIGLRATLPDGTDWLHGLAPAQWRPEPREFDLLASWMEQLVGFSELSGEYVGLMREGLGRALLALCRHRLTSLTPAHQSPETPAWLLHVVQAIRDEPGVSITCLADRAGYSVGCFRRLFNAHLGISPHAYLQRYRMTIAEHLLATTDIPINAIAERLGFENAASFTRFFTHARGLAPLHYRKASRHPIA